MVKITAFFVVSALLSLTSAAPIEKRISQIISDSTRAWADACVKAGGAGQCNTISGNAFSSLLAGGKQCDQQNAADQMVDLAKTLGNDPEMIRLAQLFVQQPRNAPDNLQVPYCRVAPKNAELNGLFHCQFAGSDFTKFSGDQTGNLPLGVAAVNPAGSCPAKADGPVPDGVQLNTLVRNPRSGAAAAPPVAARVVAAPAAPAAPAPAAARPAPAAPQNGFALQNGRDAKALNDSFAALTPASPCTDGTQACVAGGFAQCVGGKFLITQCAGGTVCAALPLVNSPGTSLTCTSLAERDARIAATGA